MEIRITGDGPRFKEKVYFNGRTLTKTFKRKTDAINWKRLTESEKMKNDSLGITGLKPNVLFSEVFDLWMDRKIIPAKSDKTIADYKSIGRKHLEGLFGNIKIRSFERNHADKLIQRLKNLELANKTANKILTVFKQVLSFAEMEGFISKSPLRNFPMLKVSAGRIDFLTNQEILQLLRANSTQMAYPLILVALNTGMRIGELTGLCWDRINFENDSIEVSRNQTRTGLKQCTKTNLVRHIPMNYEVKEALRVLLKSQRSPHYVFVDENGKPFSPDHYSQRHFRKASERAQIRKVNFHLLRHTYASQFMMKGGNIYDLQKLLGHTKVEMTMKYAHLSPQHLRKVVDTVRFSAEGDNSVSPFSAPQEKEKRNLNAV